MLEFCKKCNKPIIRKKIPYQIVKYLDSEIETYQIVLECQCGYSNENLGVDY